MMMYVDTGEAASVVVWCTQWKRLSDLVVGGQVHSDILLVLLHGLRHIRSSATGTY